MVKHRYICFRKHVLIRGNMKWYIGKSGCDIRWQITIIIIKWKNEKSSLKPRLYQNRLNNSLLIFLCNDKGEQTKLFPIKPCHWMNTRNRYNHILGMWYQMHFIFRLYWVSSLPLRFELILSFLTSTIKVLFIIELFNSIILFDSCSYFLGWNRGAW